MRITWTTERGACVVGDDRVKYVRTMRDVIVRRGAAARGPAACGGVESAYSVRRLFLFCETARGDRESRESLGIE